MGCSYALCKLGDMITVIHHPDSGYGMEHLTTDRFIPEQLVHEAQPGAEDSNQVKRNEGKNE
jgi:hypothetical protein